MKKHKFLKVIFINLVLIIIALLIAEFWLNIRYYQNFQIHIDPEITKNYKIKDYVREYFYFTYRHYNKISMYFDHKQEPFDYLFHAEDLREPVYSNSKNAENVVLFGCSYTQGTTLTAEQSLHTKLNKYWNKSVYNYGVPGGSPKEALFFLKNLDKFDKRPNYNDVEYVIYTFIDDHEKRLVSNLNSTVPNFRKNKNGELEYVDSKFESIKLSYIYREINNLLYEKQLIKNTDENLLFYIKEINKEISNKFSNGNQKTKFIVFVYTDPIFGYPKFKEALEKENITVINIKDFIDIDVTDPKYRTFDDHPSEYAWECIVPLLIKEIEKRSS